VAAHQHQASLADAGRAETARFAAGPGRLAVTEMQTMDTAVDRAESGTRFQFLLMGVFAALLAGVGLYGVLSSVVRQGMPEICVRMALGATPAGILRMVVGRELLLSAVGVAGGSIAAVASWAPERRAAAVQGGSDLAATIG
jgi:ABC-type antimicrobial peptide transport system permease subunit